MERGTTDKAEKGSEWQGTPGQPPALEENIHHVYGSKGCNGFFSYFVIVTWSAALMLQYCSLRALLQSNQAWKTLTNLNSSDWAKTCPIYHLHKRSLCSSWSLALIIFLYQVCVRTSYKVWRCVSTPASSMLLRVHTVLTGGLHSNSI